MGEEVEASLLRAVETVDLARVARPLRQPLRHSLQTRLVQRKKTKQNRDGSKIVNAGNDASGKKEGQRKLTGVFVKGRLNSRLG